MQCVRENTAEILKFSLGLDFEKKKKSNACARSWRKKIVRLEKFSTQCGNFWHGSTSYECKQKKLLFSEIER